MMKVKLCPMALKAVSFEIDDLIGKEGEVVERTPDGSWIVQFSPHRVYALPEHYLGEPVLEITFDDTHVEPPVPEVVKKATAPKKKLVVKPKVVEDNMVGLEVSPEGTIVKKKTDGRTNTKQNTY